jgi:hypothetical protein
VAGVSPLQARLIALRDRLMMARDAESISALSDDIGELRADRLTVRGLLVTRQSSVSIKVLDAIIGGLDKLLGELDALGKKLSAKNGELEAAVVRRKAHTTLLSRLRALGGLDTGASWSRDASVLQVDISSWLTENSEHEPVLAEKLKDRPKQLSDADAVMPTIDRCIRELDEYNKVTDPDDGFSDQLLALQMRIEGSQKGLESIHSVATDPDVFKALRQRLERLHEGVSDLQSDQEQQQQQQQQQVGPTDGPVTLDDRFTSAPESITRRAIRQWAADLRASVKKELARRMRESDKTPAFPPKEKRAAIKRADAAKAVSDRLDQFSEIDTLAKMRLRSDEVDAIGVSTGGAWKVFEAALVDVAKRGR